MEALEKISGVSIPNEQQCGYDEGQIVVEVESDVIEHGAKGSCSEGLESSATNQTSKVDIHVVPLSPQITVSGNRSPCYEDDDEEEDDDEVYDTYQCRTRWKVNRKKLVEYIIFLCSLGVLVASFTVEKLEDRKVLGLEIWKCCVLVMLLFCGMLVTNWVFTVLSFFVEANYMLKNNTVVFFVHRIKKTVQIFLWTGMVLLTWLFFFKFNHGSERSKISSKILDHITWTLVSLVIGAFLWMLSSLLFTTLSSKFIAVPYFDKIQEIIFHKNVITSLLGPPLFDSGFLSSNSLGSVVNKVRDARKVSVRTMDLFITDAAANLTSVTNELEAKTLAFKIFKNVSTPGCKYIDKEDLLRFMVNEEVNMVLSLFQGASETGEIGKRDLRDWVVDVYRENNALHRSILDTKAVLKQLQQFCNSIVIGITIVVWLLVVGIASTNLVVFLSTQFLLAAFIFGNTCKNVFEAIVFIFLTHPFDVGDRIVVDDIPLVVEEMNVLTTTFLKPNDEKVYYPNSLLCTKTISNYNRSPVMRDTVEFSIVLPSAEKLNMLKTKITEYLDSKPQHWCGGHSVVVINIEDVNKLRMALKVCHTKNFQQIDERMERRTELVIKLMQILEELNITYNLLPQ